MKELPREGNFLTLKILRSLKSNLGLSEDEFKKFNIKQNGEQVTWNDKDDDVEIEIGEKATDIIVETLKKLDENKKLTEEHFSLYEKFIEG